MNHYEELGVSQSATTAEIRQAYKALVRVLHPDRQREEDLRRLSELQLRRLNHLLQVLTDPVQRRQYDLSLVHFPPAPPSPEAAAEVSRSGPGPARLHLSLTPGVLIWALIGAIAVGSAMVWLRAPQPVVSRPVISKAVESQAVPPPELRQPSAAPAQPDPRSRHAPAAATEAPGKERSREDPGSLSQRKADLMNQARPKANIRAGVSNDSKDDATAPASVPRIAAIEPWPNPARKPGADPANPEIAAIVPPSPLDSQTTPAPASPPSPTKPRAGPISGKWLYVPQPDDSKRSLYPPEYIELLIHNQAGVLRGRYHGKYRVADRAISSEINFQFEGRQGEAVSILPWAGSNGSRGELRLRRVSEEALEVHWITTTFGQANTLASGTAVLYRSDPP